MHSVQVLAMVRTAWSALWFVFIILPAAAQIYTECGGELSAPTGLIMSPQYPMSYPNNAICQWIIASAENEIIDLRFDSLDIDGSMGRCPDFIDIYDGPNEQAARLHHMCQQRSEDELAELRIRSTGNRMKITFISDSSYPRSGFLMNYWTHECNRFSYGLENCDQNCSCSKMTSDYCNNLNGSCVCKKGWNGPDCSQDVNECVVSKVELCGDYQNCVNTVGGYDCKCAPGLVKNQTGQCNVADTAMCTNKTCSHACAKIQANDTSTQEDTCLCPNNMVLMGDGCQACPKLKFGKNCRLGCQCVEAKTEKCDDATGECLCLPQWTSADCSQDLDECSVSNSNCRGTYKQCINTYGGFNCTCSYGYRLNDNMNCEEIAFEVRHCSYELDEANGTLMSPNYPGNYYDKARCTWKISAPNTTATIVFNVSDLMFETCCDYLIVQDGSAEYSYLALPSTGIVRSNSNAITVTFISDMSVTYRGFLATYYVSDAPGCGHVLNALSGYLSIPLNPNGTFYSCYWSIRPLYSPGVVTLSVTEFNVSCADGYVDVYSSIPPRYQSRLGRYCGSASVSLIRSHSGVMYIQFYSNTSDTIPRFNGSYLAHTCPHMRFGPDCTTPCICNASNTQKCQDTDGNCVCNGGWTSADCSEDINECLRNPCPASTTCVNSPGRYACVISRTGPSGQINCPHYESNAYGIVDYLWTITGEPNTVVSLKLLNFKMSNSFWCSNELTIYDGKEKNSRLIGRYCGSDMPRLIRTTGNVLHMTLKNHYVVSNCFTGNYSVHACRPLTFGPSCTRLCRCLKERTDFCDNVNGFCKCKPGWTGRDCSRDVNECRSAGNFNCPDNSVCRNVPGAFECHCLRGFNMSGGQCVKTLDCPEVWRNKYCSHACYLTEHNEPVCTCPDRLDLRKINEKSYVCVVPFYPRGEKLELIKNGTKHRSKQIHLSNRVPFGKSKASSSFYIMRDGVIVFDQPDMSFTPNLKRASEHKQKLIAALWSEMDTSKGDVYLNMFEKCGSLALHELQASKVKAEVMQRAERDIEEYHSIPDFETSTVVIVSWDKVQQPKKKDKLTFQAVFISGFQRQFKNGQLVLDDEEIAFALLVYQAGRITWPINGLVPVGVGYVNEDDFKDVIEGNSNKVNSLYKRAWIPGSTDKGVILFTLGSFGGPEKSCQKYLCKQSPLLLHPMYQNELDELYKCPCTLDRLGLQWQLFETRGDIKCYAISIMVKRRLLPHNIRNKLCCYKLPKDSTDNWISQLQATSYLQNSPEGGHILISDPWDTSDNSQKAKEQLHAHKSCCSHSNREMCNRFYKIFPDKQCSNQVKFIPAFAIGDPHITTCDGITYAMNGLGEFIMMSVPSENFTLQARTGRAETSNGTLTNATVFTAFAARESSTSSFQVELALNNKTMVLILNGIDQTNDFYKDREFMALTDSVIVTRENRKNITAVKAIFACGVAIEVHVGLKNLEISLQVEEYLHNKTTGLMGNCNGNVSDDFILPNGTLLDSNSTERQILEQFVRQFQVTAGTTIFTYEEGEGYTDFIDEDFLPYFGDELDMEVSYTAKELCGASDYACIFDYAVTGDQNFAKNTKASKSENEVIVSNLENETPVIKSFTGTTIYNNRWTVTIGKENTLQVIAMDSDGDELSYHTDENSTHISVDNGGKITFIPTDYNLLLLQIRVKDSKSGYSSAEFVSLVYCSNCSGHGICSNKTASVVKSKLSCDCYPAYTGEECEEEIDACESLPCQDGRNCSDLTAAEQGYSTIGFKCGPCQIGFHDGLLDTCLDIDECEDEKVCDQTCTNTYGSFVCTCEAGYRLDHRDGITCIDVNECEERTAVCQQNCENIDSSYNCFCNDGYTLNDDRSTCDLESRNVDVCKSCQQICILSQDIPSCGCFRGYEQDPDNDTQCIDVNECVEGNMPCSQNCTNTEGHFKCSCYAGYQLAEDGSTCSSCESSYFGEDCKNMCECNIHGVCDPVQGCICEAGWLGDNCDEDVDECLQADSCPDGQVCENQRGTFHCVCPEGLRKEEGVCIDVDECAEPEFRTVCNFEANEICINTQGSYSCGCKKGFTCNVLSICEDINECLIGIDGCEQLCDNVDGGYNCKCYPGYRKAEDRHQCVDVKELCKNQNLDCSHGCSIDNNGNPVCVCPRGYHLHGSNRCEDINECADPSENLCSFKQGCLNINGSHVCSCPAGQRLENDNRTCHECDESTWGDNCANDCSCGQGSARCDPVTGCVCKSGFTGQFCSEDVNECATGQLSCPDNEVCVNLPGSSRCQCREGYFKKNEICTDVNECDDKRLHNCKQVCTNSLGSFNCSCYPGYAYNDLNNTCTDINECDRNLSMCNEICTNTEGSYRCSCTSGQPLQADGITCGVKICRGKECPDHLECRSQKSTYECVCFNGLKPNSDLQCEDCNRILNDNSGKIMTSFYPQNYSEDSQCSWTIHLNETNAIISLTINQFEVEGCPYDYLEIYDGPNADAQPIGQYCDEAPGTVRSTGNSMHIVFYSDSSENRNGFIGSYAADSQCRHKNCSHTCKVISTKPCTEECLCSEWMKLDETGTTCLEIHACNTTINESSGYIVSPGYPENYPDATDCHWTFEAVENAVITLSFSAFALEGGIDCPYDYVQVFEGISNNASQLGLYCGGEIPLNLNSTSKGMHLIFRSDNAVNSGGFKAEFFIK